MTTIGCEQALWGALGSRGENRGPPSQESLLVGTLRSSLQCTCLLGGRKLLVYVRTTVTAIFDVMTEENSGRVKIVTLGVVPFPPRFSSLTWRFREQNIRAPEENSCIAG